jgi:hypothetical protein
MREQEKRLEPASKELSALGLQPGFFFGGASNGTHEVRRHRFADLRMSQVTVTVSRHLL